MAVVQGTRRTVTYLKETSYGVAPAKTGFLLPRVETSLNATFETYASEEINSNLQRSESVIGFEKVEGEIKGELACGQWSDFFAGALRSQWGSATLAPIVGENASTQKKGRVLFVANSEHRSDSFFIEDSMTQASLHRKFYGCRVSKLSLDIQPSGITGITVGFLGQRSEETTAAHFTTKNEQSRSGKLTGVQGSLLLNGSRVGLVTGLTIDIDLNASSEAVLGQSYAPDVFIGQVAVSGTMNVYLQDRSLLTALRNGSNLALAVRLNETNATITNYMNIVLPNIKLSSIDLDDGNKNIIQSVSFDAFPGGYSVTSTGSNPTTTVINGANPTTIIIQDSLANLL